jgi:hypothetical protein
MIEMKPRGQSYKTFFLALNYAKICVGSPHFANLYEIWCIIDLRLCSQILNVPNEKSRCVVLSNRNGHLIDTIHPAYLLHFHYVFMQIS